ERTAAGVHPVLLSFFFSSRRRHTRFSRDWSSDVCSSDLGDLIGVQFYVMEKVPGHVVRDQLPDGWAETPEERRAMAFALADTLRSEERRVGKECRERGSAEH